jgi:hypothetical protein
MSKSIELLNKLNESSSDYEYHVDHQNTTLAKYDKKKDANDHMDKLNTTKYGEEHRLVKVHKKNKKIISIWDNKGKLLP